MNEEQENTLVALLEPIDVSVILSNCEEASKEVDQIVDEVGIKVFGDESSDAEYELDTKTAQKVASSAISLIDEASTEASSLLTNHYTQAQNIYSAFFSSDDSDIIFPYDSWFSVYSVPASSCTNLIHSCSYEKSLDVLAKASSTASGFYNNKIGRYQTNDLFLLDFINTVFNNYDNIINIEDIEKSNIWLTKISKKVSWLSEDHTLSSSNLLKLLKAQKDLFIKMSNLGDTDVKPNAFFYIIMALSYNNENLLDEIEKKLQDKYFNNIVLTFTKDLLGRLETGADKAKDPRDSFMHSYLFDLRKISPANASEIFLGNEKTNNLFSIREQIKGAPSHKTYFGNPSTKYVANSFALKNMAKIDTYKYPLAANICELILGQFLNASNKPDLFFNSNIALEVEVMYQKIKLEKSILISEPNKSVFNARNVKV